MDEYKFLLNKNHDNQSLVKVESITLLFFEKIAWKIFVESLKVIKLWADGYSPSKLCTSIGASFFSIFSSSWWFISLFISLKAWFIFFWFYYFNEKIGCNVW